MPPSLKALGFSSINTELRKRRGLTYTVAGWEKSGKTTLGLTAEKPIAWFNLDKDLEYPARNFLGDEIYFTQIQVDKKTAKAEYARFWTLYRAVLKNHQIRTVLIDTESCLWQLARLGDLGALTADPKLYQPVNAKFANVTRLAQEADKNVILTRRVKDRFIHQADKKAKKEFEEGKTTKVLGYSETQYNVDVNLTVKRDVDEFHFEVENNSINAAYNGEVFGDAACNLELFQLKLLSGKGPG